MVFLVSGFIFAYLLFKVVIPLQLGRKVKLAVGGLLFLATQQHTIVQALSRTVKVVNVPPAVPLFQGWLLVTLIFLTLLFLCQDAFQIAVRLMRRKVAPPAFSPGRRRLLMACCAVAPAAYGIRQAVIIPDVRRMETYLPGLPPELDGLTVAHLSDTHISLLLQGDWTRAVVEKTNALKPDLILLTGDIVDGFPARRTNESAPLKDLKARHGVFACPGNHEYYSDYTAWMRTLPGLGVTPLCNSHTVLTINGQPLVLAGVTDEVAKRYNLPMPNIDAALAGAPPHASRILMSHRPGKAKEYARAGISLQLSGHTHGGQIIGMDMIVARLNKGFLRGWYQVNTMQMYVHPGTGLSSMFPVRLGVPSAISLLTLRSPKALA